MCSAYSDALKLHLSDAGKEIAHDRIIRQFPLQITGKVLLSGQPSGREVIEVVKPVRKHHLQVLHGSQVAG